MDIKEETAARDGHWKILGKRLMSEPLIEVVKEEPQLMREYQSL